MAKSNKRDAAVQKDLRELINLVTGFHDKEVNFKLCLQYAESQFKFHRYLSPDSHKIHRAIDGLCEKFQVASQGQKAAHLKDLTEKFLDQPGLDGRQCGKTDVHYSLLSLLINLACNPTQSQFVKKEAEVIQEEVDDFDWKNCLLDAEDVMFLSHASSESDIDELDDDSDLDKDEKSVRFAGDVTSQDLYTDRSEQGDASRTLSNSTHGSQSSFPFSGADATLENDELKQLESALVVEYWKGKSREGEAGGGHSVCNIARDWRTYQQRMNPLEQLPHQIVVSEMQLIRETLWMLSGVTQLFVFLHDDNGFHLNPDVYVLHLTPECLESSLTPLMQAAQQVHLLDMFDDVIAGGPCHSEFSDQQTTNQQRQKNVPLTYVAFSACVDDFLAEFRRELLDIEKSVIKQDKTILLSSLAADLRPWMAKIEAVHRVILHGISSTSDGIEGSAVDRHVGEITPNNCVKATRLLDTLYQFLFEADLASLNDDGASASLILHMLIKTSEPLLQVISDWINNGLLNDLGGDFVLQSNQSIESLEESFWDNAFVPSVTSVPRETSTAATGPHHSSSQVTALDLPGNIGVGGPKLLQPIMKEVILAGKSMAMLENLGKIWEAVNITNRDALTFERPPSLYELFVRDLCEALPSSNCEDNATDRISNRSPSVKASPSCIIDTQKDVTIERQLNRPGVKDTLMNINFASLFSDLSAEGKTTEQQCPTSADSGMYPVMNLLEKCLHPHVSARYSVVCSKLVNILKEDYDLVGYIHAMQRYYLMSCGEVMYDFYTPVFDKIEKREDWRDYHLLEMYLHEAVDPVYPRDVARLSVEINSAAIARQKSAINATDCICLRYRIPWPVNVVISASCEKLYNDVFAFILQIKRAKCTLDELRFEDVSREQAVPTSVPPELFPGMEVAMSRKCRIHQFYVLRFRLQNFVNILHNYIMTRILHSTELEFGPQLDAAPDLDQIIHIHRQYVNAIHNRCLLHPRLSVLREAVLRVLNLCLTFGQLWRHGVDFTSPEAMKEVDLEHTRCLHFLSTFLQNVIKRGSYPHLESLAFALSSSLPSKDV